MRINATKATNTHTTRRRSDSRNASQESAEAMPARKARMSAAVPAARPHRCIALCRPADENAHQPRDEVNHAKQAQRRSKPGVERPARPVLRFLWFIGRTVGPGIGLRFLLAQDRRKVSENRLGDAFRENVAGNVRRAHGKRKHEERQPAENAAHAGGKRPRPAVPRARPKPAPARCPATARRTREAPTGSRASRYTSRRRAAIHPAARCIRSSITIYC